MLYRFLNGFTLALWGHKLRSKVWAKLYLDFGFGPMLFLVTQSGSELKDLQRYHSMCSTMKKLLIISQKTGEQSHKDWR